MVNARRLATSLESDGFRIVSGGTDNHLFLLDVGAAGLTGKLAEESLDAAGITANKNTIPFDDKPPLVASGLRIGTPALTSRGMGGTQMDQVAAWIGAVLRAPGDEEVRSQVQGRVAELCRQFPLYDALW